jgi:hypothetical protein
MALPDEWLLEVQFPVEDGYLAHKCSGADCGRYFKIHVDDIGDRLSCPYCGHGAARDDFLTADQRRHVDAAIENEIMPAIETHLDEVFHNAFSGPSWTFTSGAKRALIPKPPIAAAREADSRLTCPVCALRFQVDGIFGLCPRCQTDNLRVYDADVALIRRQLAEDPNPNRALRHAYVDGVSTFEVFCRREAERSTISTAKLQNLRVARERFLKARGVDIVSSLTAEQSLALRRLLQKRHAWEHNDGLVDAKYVKEVPEDAALLGDKAPLSLAEFETAMGAMRFVLDVLVSSRPQVDTHLDGT